MSEVLRPMTDRAGGAHGEQRDAGGRAPAAPPSADGRTLAGTIEAIGRELARHRRIAVAVSGGIDSLTLATLAGARPQVEAQMFHAVSPAVPAEATARVRGLAARQGWRLQVIDAAEFARAAREAGYHAGTTG